MMRVPCPIVAPCEVLNKCFSAPALLDDSAGARYAAHAFIEGYLSVLRSLRHLACGTVPCWHASCHHAKDCSQQLLRCTASCWCACWHAECCSSIMVANVLFWWFCDTIVRGQHIRHEYYVWADCCPISYHEAIKLRLSA